MHHFSSASLSSSAGDLARISQLEEKSAKLQEDLNVALREKNTHLEEILRFRTESSAAEKELRRRVDLFLCFVRSLSLFILSSSAILGG
jgi:hypothetical protein